MVSEKNFGSVGGAIVHVSRAVAVEASQGVINMIEPSLDECGPGCSEMAVAPIGFGTSTGDS